MYVCMYMVDEIAKWNNRPTLAFSLRPTKIRLKKCTISLKS